MRQRLWATRRDEDGFTLVESLVGMVVISIVFAAMAGFLVTAIKVQTANERRIKAAQVGNQTIEDLRALPWNLLGYYASDPGYAATYDGQQTVTLAPPADGVRDSRVPLPGPQNVTVAGVTYSRTVNIVWYDEPGDGIGAADDDGNLRDAKRIVTQLGWGVGAESKSLVVQGLRSPTVEEVLPRGQGVVSPFRIQSFTANPSSAILAWNGTTEATITFTVKLSLAATQARLSYVDRNGLTTTATMSAPSSNTDWTYTLPIGSGPFNTGPQNFSVRAYAPAGATADGTVSVQFAISSTALDLSTPSVNPSSVDIDANGRNLSAITVTADATTPVTSMTVTYPTKAGNVTATMNLSNNSKTGTYTLPAMGDTFASGVKTWVVNASGATVASRSASVTFVPPAPPPVTMISLVISPVLCAHNGNGALNRASTVTVTMTGLATTDKVKLEFNDGLATRVNASYSSTDAAGQYRYTVLLPTGSMKWSTVSNPTVAATATRTADATQTQRIFSVPVSLTSGAASCP